MTVDGGLGQIQGDERKIRQVVPNLRSNAIKLTPEGRRIEVEAVPRDGSVEVYVSDTGVGIAPEDHTPTAPDLPIDYAPAATHDRPHLFTVI
jgi:signal transduction histidine kinase